MDSNNGILQKLKRYLPQIKKYAPLALVVVVLVVTFATCGRGEAPTLEDPEPTTIESPPPSEPPVDIESPAPSEPQIDPEPDPDPEYTGPFNPLTGLPTETDFTNIRPLAIMINNSYDSLPQLGVSKADIIYELLVEGGITRMLALYQDVNDVGNIGSVRSARHYYVDIAQSYDAVYLYAGGSPQANTALASRNITHLDGNLYTYIDIYFRDTQRLNTLGYEHSLLTSGTRIALGLVSHNIAMEHAEGYQRALSFAEDGTPQDGEPALGFDVRFSSYKTTSFNYDDSDGLYYLRQYGNPYRDGNDSVQLSVTNVLILKTMVSHIPNDSEGRLNVTTTGSGTGYYVNGGKYIEIEWSREDNYTSQFIYTLPDGSELILGQGQTYICIIPNEYDVSFE